LLHDAWTVLRLIRWTDERFKKEGLLNPRLDAEVLLGNTLGMDRVGLYTHFDQPLAPAELEHFKKLIQRRLRHEPIAYILGRREFWSLSFKVTPEVLIPRPETEVLVAEALRLLSPMAKPGAQLRILEIGTGCGAISVALAKELPEAFITATDISAKALEIAQENATQNGVGQRLHFLQGNLFSPFEQGLSFELIITNPPYIPHDQLLTLAPEVRNYEPWEALDGGEEGLNYFRRILPKVTEFLRPKGWFLSEIGAGQDEKIQSIAGQNGELNSGSFIQDLAGIKRVFKAQKNSAS
jgi:release factor glutamine methyltransferase